MKDKKITLAEELEKAIREKEELDNKIQMLENELNNIIQFDDNLFKEYILKYFKISNCCIGFTEFSNVYLVGEDYVYGHAPNSKLFEDEFCYRKFIRYYRETLEINDCTFFIEVNKNKYKIKKKNNTQFAISLIDTNIKQVIKDFNIDISNINLNNLIEYDFSDIEEYIDTIKNIKKDLNFIFL